MNIRTSIQCHARWATMDVFPSGPKVTGTYTLEVLSCWPAFDRPTFISRIQFQYLVLAPVRSFKSIKLQSVLVYNVYLELNSQRTDPEQQPPINSLGKFTLG